MEIELLYILITLAIGIITGWGLHRFIQSKNTVTRNDFEALNQKYITAITGNQFLENSQLSLSAEIQAKQVQNDKIAEELQALKIHMSEFKEKYRSLEEKEKALKEEIENIGLKFGNQFELLANRILEEKSEKFTKANADNIKQILEPLGLDIKNFKQKVEEVYDKESKERFSLKNEINKLNELNIKLSDEANNLTKALKGDAKTQGDWGEIILESILEKSGLTRGREYIIQDSYRDAEGKLYRPDVIIALPDNRKIVIDSKVSLTAYERYVAAESESERETFLNKHVKSIYGHIDILSKKNYQDLLGESSLDFVLMFVPIEPAHMTAMYHDMELWQYAYSKGIVMVSPTNLLSSMKLISDLWQREKQNKNALDIAERSGALYDKFVSFTDSLRDVGMYIQRSQKSYDEAINQLSEGRGNIISQIEKMKSLGAKAKKDMPEKLLQKGLDADSESLN